MQKDQIEETPFLTEVRKLGPHSGVGTHRIISIIFAVGSCKLHVFYDGAVDIEDSDGDCARVFWNSTVEQVQALLNALGTPRPWKTASPSEREAT